eukprot:Phypoly_transcript_17243.p1 GENE.Phypoly_transcript_17243~~Phypoly_transcript_17243.p1  ORF type:complete len:103 (+),score=14.20 Phypoly_transcript_17243:402-710(+)
MLKGLYNRAVELEDMAYPIFGQADCEARFLLSELMPQISQFRDEDCLQSVHTVDYSTEEDRIAKIKAVSPGGEYVTTTVGDYSKKEVTISSVKPAKKNFQNC